MNLYRVDMHSKIDKDNYYCFHFEAEDNEKAIKEAKEYVKDGVEDTELGHVDCVIEAVVLLDKNEKDVETIFKSYQVGDTFKPKRSRVEYTVVATFQDNGEEFVVAKKPMGYGSWSYGNVFAYDEDGNLYQRS